MGGESVPIENVPFNNEKTKAAYEFASQFETTEKAQAALDLYEYNLDESTDWYKEAFDKYYNAGLRGIGDFESADSALNVEESYPEYWRKAVFIAGRNQKSYKPGVNRMYFNEALAKRNAMQFEILDAIGKKYNLSFLVFDTLEGDMGSLNGIQIGGGNKIAISLDADGSLYLRTAGHEVFHFIEEWNSAEAAKLTEKVINYLKSADEYDYSERVQEYAEWYGIDPDTEEGLKKIHSEIVADSMFDVFSNEKFLKKLVKENKTLAEKIGDCLKKFIAELHKILKLYTDSPEMNALKEQTAALEDVNKSFEAALKTASENMLEQTQTELSEKSQKNTADSGVIKFSLMNEKSFEENVKSIFTMGDVEARKNDSQGNFVRVMDNTPKVILDNVKDAKNLQVIMKFDSLYLATRKVGVVKGHYHNLGDIILKLPEILSSPDAVVRMKNGRLNILANVETPKGKNGIVSMEMNTVKDINSKNNKYNLIISAFSAKDNYLKNIIKNNAVFVEYKKDDLTQVNPQLYEWLATVNAKSSNNIVSNAENNVKYSLKKQTDSDGNELSEEQIEYFKNSKVRDEDGNLLKVYHGTDAEFTVFDNSKGRANMDIQGSFFSPWQIDAAGYGSNVKSYYLNIKNPASEGVAYRALNKFKGQNNAGVKARKYLESLGYDGVNNENEEYIAFYPNQIKLADNLKPTGDSDVRYSIKEIVDENNKSYGIGVKLDSEILDNLSPKERINTVKDFVKNLGGTKFVAYDKNQNAVNISIADKGAMFKNKNGKWVSVNKDLSSKYIKNEAKQDAIVLIDELVTTSKHDGNKPSAYPHGWLDNYGKNDWEYWYTYIQDKNKTVWEATLNVANATNGNKILYDISLIKKAGRAVKSAGSTTNNIISETSEKSTGKSQKNENMKESLKISKSGMKILSENPELANAFEKLQNELQLAKGYIPDTEIVKGYAKELKKEYLCTLKNAEIETELLGAYEILSTTDDSRGYELAAGKVHRLAEKVLQNTKMLDDENSVKAETRDRLNKYLRGRKWYLSPGMRAEIINAYGSYGNFHKRIFGHGFSFSESETNYLDSDWEELCAEFRTMNCGEFPTQTA